MKNDIDEIYTYTFEEIVNKKKQPDEIKHTFI